MLNSLLLVFFLSNVFVNSLNYILILFIIEFLLNIFLNKTLVSNIKKLRFLGYIYIFSLFTYIFTRQEGEVIWKIFDIYITKEALISFGINFLRVINLIMISWLIREEGLLTNIFGRYKKIVEKVIELVPEVFIVLKKRLKIKSFLRQILTRIKEKNI